ncbi:MAG: YdiU family protein [Bdellovibrionales bacterium]|nr:YdiU family protein [Bdellovibrionales bacterium]NQZ18737.1 YdiU family protein [Bdellovibrionales bacterium]
MEKLSLQNTYLNLPKSFYQKVEPSAAVDPAMIKLNEELASELKLPWEQWSPEEQASIFSGQTLLPGSEPVALAYAGHQFGHFVPQLGDGRAVLLGQAQGYDLQLKGSGLTPFSRGGDGRSSLGPVLREYIISEAMFALGVPTTRTLAAVTTGDFVRREEMLPGGISTRVASSHIRIGSFEYIFNKDDVEGLKALVDFAIEKHDSEISSDSEKYFKFFQRVGERLLSTVAQWMGLGFIHGVMNTDNMLISGETIDYGPCAFMDNFEFLKVFSSIDRRGRYAYDRQGEIAIWNLSSLASTLIPLVDKDPQKAVKRLEDDLGRLNRFFENKNLEVMAHKMGIFEPKESDRGFIGSYLKFLEENKKDFTNSFRDLPQMMDSKEPVYQEWQKRIYSQSQSVEESIELMNSKNPIVIPRNHRVEQAIQSAYQGDYSVFHELIEVTAQPFKDNKKWEAYKKPPMEDEVVTQTFCGT